MEDGDGEDPTPFWVHSTTNGRRRHITTALVVFLLLLVIVLLFLVFAVPTSPISFSAQIIKPNSVKRGWDSLNIVLVLVAVVFGFLSRNKNNEDKHNSYYDDFQASTSKQNGSQKPSTPSTPNRWYRYSYDNPIEGPKSNFPNSSQWYEDSDYQAKLERKNSILTRNSSSYPDLRETSTTTHWSYGHYYQRRYYDDDIRVDSGRIRNTGQGQDRDTDQGKTHHRRHRSLEGVENLRAPLQNKTVIVETLISKSKGVVEEKLKMGKSESAATGSHRSSTKLNNDFEPPMGRKKERSNRRRIKDMELKDPISTPPQAAPSPPSPPRQRSTNRKRAQTTGSSTKDFLNSLYNKKKRKQRQKSVDDSDSPLSFQVPPPPPFQNLFSSKKHNRRRTITVTLEPQTPFPPAPTPREPESTTLHSAPPPTQNPPKPIKMATFDKLEEISNSGGESPLNRIPPPPPPPPLAAFYKSPAWKFVVQGDYVRVNSITDTDEGESDVTPSSVGAGAAASYFHPSPPLFCASPDVDTKAESFITNFRAKLKLDKIHSMKKRDVGLSGLGPGPGPTQFTQRK